MDIEFIDNFREQYYKKYIKFYKKLTEIEKFSLSTYKSSGYITINSLLLSWNKKDLTMFVYKKILIDLFEVLNKKMFGDLYNLLNNFYQNYYDKTKYIDNSKEDKKYYNEQFNLFIKDNSNFSQYIFHFYINIIYHINKIFSMKSLNKCSKDKLYKGIVQMSYFYNIFKKAKKGDIITINGFCSTTVNPYIAYSFGGKIVLDITNKIKIPCLYLPWETTDITENNISIDEFELLLPIGCIFKINKISKKSVPIINYESLYKNMKYENIIYIEVDLIGYTPIKKMLDFDLNIKRELHLIL